MRLTEKHLDIIRKHYPREGCEQPWNVATIAREIGCTACAVDYNAAKLGFGKWGYQDYLEGRKRYRETHREQIRENAKRIHREKYRNDPIYRRKRLFVSNKYYYDVVKPKRMSHDKKADI